MNRIAVPGPARWRIALAASLVVAFAIAGSFLVRSAEGAAAIRWMYIYHPEDFSNLEDMARFLRGLRVPIPPVLAAAEILEHQLRGNTVFMTGTLYRLSLVAVYLVPILLSFPSVPRMVLGFGLGLVFLAATVAVHPGNPQTYDVYWPLAFLLYVLALRGAAGPRKSILPAAAAGFLLAMTELLRPFMLLLLPLLLLCSLRMLRNRPLGQNLAFLAPVVLISGGWHLHLFLQHGQLIASNHSGFNLRRCWSMVKLPPLVKEIGNTPLAPDRWPNLNTPEHFENSRRLQRSVLGYVASHPRRSLKHLADRLRAQVIDVPVDIYSHEPRSRILAYYRPLVRLLAAYLTIQLLVLATRLLRPSRLLKDLASADGILLLTATLSTLILAIGDQAEEARFLVSLLPLFTTLPSMIPGPGASSGAATTQLY